MSVPAPTEVKLRKSASPTAVVAKRAESPSHPPSIDQATVTTTAHVAPVELPTIDAPPEPPLVEKTLSNKKLVSKRDIAQTVGIYITTARVARYMKSFFQKPEPVSASASASAPEEETSSKPDDEDTSDDDARDIHVGGVQVRFSDKTFVVLALLIQSILRPWLMHGFSATQSNKVANVTIKHMYSSGVDKLPFIALLYRLPSFQTHVNAELVEQHRAEHLVALQRGGLRIPKGSTPKSKTNDTAEKSVVVVPKESKESKDIKESKDVKTSFTHHISCYCKQLVPKKDSGDALLHMTSTLLEHLSTVTKEIISLFAYGAFEITVQSGGKTISHDHVLLAARLFLMNGQSLAHRIEHNREEDELHNALNEVYEALENYEEKTAKRVAE